MTENKVIACFIRDRSAYERLVPFIEKYKSFTPFGEMVLREVSEFYSTDPKATSVDVDLIRQKLVAANPKKDFLIDEYLSSLPSNISVDNVLRLYEDMYKESIKLELISYLSSRGMDKHAEELIEKLQTANLEEEDDAVFNGETIDNLLVHFNADNLIPIYPSALNEALGGGVPRQSQLCIMARPDVGKSTVAINIAVGAAERGFKVLYVGNEDPAPKMVMRIISRFLRTPEVEFKKTPTKSYEEAIRRGYKNIFFKEMHPGNYAELRKWVEKLKPDMLVIDQIRNMHFKTEGMTMNLEAGVIALRNLAKEFNLVSVVVTQAGNSAANKLRLDMEDVEWSNTGVAAQMDLMIGVGQNQELREQNMVVLSFPKNKFTAPIQPISATIQYDINRLTVKA